MPGAATEEDVYSAIEESAELVGAACSREKVWPYLTAYSEALAEGGIIFTVTTSERHAENPELDYTIQLPPGSGDPYAQALAHGFVAQTDHPVGSLLAELQARVSVSDCLIDCGVLGGFKKVYVNFPHDLQRVSEFADIPSMPRAVAENADFFARHGLDYVAMVAIDYQRRTMNPYFQLRDAGNLEPETVLAILSELGMQEPDERVLAHARKSYRVYPTLSWDSSKIERISFAPQPRRDADLSAIHARLEPGIEQFMRRAPYVYAGERVRIAAVKWSYDGDELNLGSYYQLSSNWPPAKGVE